MVAAEASTVVWCVHSGGSLVGSVVGSVGAVSSMCVGEVLAFGNGGGLYWFPHPMG